MAQTRNPTLAVVGGGLAGLAAAVAAAERGLRVELFERRRELGGRAGSFRDPVTGQLVDHCRHVSMGCCTNLADFCRRIGIADCFRRQRRLHFFAPDGTRHDFAAARWLPAPLHLVPGLMRLRYLTLRERLGIIRAMRQLAREPADGTDRETVGPWLRRHGQSERVIKRFWSVVLVSALSETVDRASLAAAQKVFVDGFLASRRAYELEVPQVPLGEMFDRRARAWLAERDIAVDVGTRVKRIDGNARRATALVLADGSRREFDFVVAAVSWRHIRPLLAPAMLEAMPALAAVEQIRPVPITAVHLWFDRPVTSLPHAALIGKLSQWVFSSKSQSHGFQHDAGHSDQTNYCQVVISASHELIGTKREEVVARVCDELGQIWPDARAARLLHWRVVTHPAAVFSVRPGLERLRPVQRTPLENLLLAGDWTATGWPATMEGAVRSGYLAIQGVLQSLGRTERLVVPELPRTWLARK